MIINLRTTTGWLCTLFALGLAVGGANSADNKDFSIAYVSLKDDPYYENKRRYTGLSLKDRYRPRPGAEVAMKESRILGRALGIRYRLSELELSTADAAVERIRQAMTENIRVFLLDLPLEHVLNLARAESTAPVILINIRHRDDRLRNEWCVPNLFHTLPSDAMIADALAQFLRMKDWREVLIVEGEDTASRIISSAFQRSSKKFGLDIVDVRPFVLGNDPRVRDQNNVALMTSGDDHDVVFIADSIGEVSRYIPYNTQRPRPVVGSDGLEASAWHWTWERHGAPQLNQRFRKASDRNMSSTDYAAWLAVKSVVQAIVRTESTEIPVLREFLVSDDFTLDTYKGAPGNFRPWDRQLRQNVLLHTHNAVIARAPLSAFLHQHNNLDTLGPDRPESRCVM